MKFLKENSYEISKLFINQIGISIFALCLTSAASSAFGGNNLTLILLSISIFSLCFFGVLLYQAAWEMGSKDKIRFEGKNKTLKDGQTQNDVTDTHFKKAIFLAVCASFPQMFVSIIGAVFALFENVSVLSSISSFCNIILRFGSTQYIGMIQPLVGLSASEGPWYLFLSSLYFFVFSIIPISVTVLGYAFGYDKKTFSSFFTKKKEDR